MAGCLDVGWQVFWQKKLRMLCRSAPAHQQGLQLSQRETPLPMAQLPSCLTGKPRQAPSCGRKAGTEDAHCRRVCCLLTSSSTAEAQAGQTASAPALGAPAITSNTPSGSGTAAGAGAGQRKRPAGHCSLEAAPAR